MLFKENGKPKHESAAQLLFYAIASIYCESNNLVLSREPNAGRGPVDFKIADGNFNVIVDIKLSTNSRLFHSYTHQIPTYMQAEKSSHAIILVLKMNEKSQNTLTKLLKMAQKNKSTLPHVIEVIIGDAILKPSASKL